MDAGLELNSWNIAIWLNSLRTFFSLAYVATLEFPIRVAFRELESLLDANPENQSDVDLLPPTGPSVSGKLSRLVDVVEVESPFLNQVHKFLRHSLLSLWFTFYSALYTGLEAAAL